MEDRQLAVEIDANEKKNKNHFRNEFKAKYSEEKKHKQNFHRIRPTRQQYTTMAVPSIRTAFH